MSWMSSPLDETGNRVRAMGSRPLRRCARGPMAISAGIQYRIAMVNLPLQSNHPAPCAGSEALGRVLLMLPLASERPLQSRPAQPAPRVVTDARDWLDHEHTRSVRGRVRAER